MDFCFFLLLTLNDNTIKLNNFKTINPFGRDGSQKKKGKKTLMTISYLLFNQRESEKKKENS